MGEGRDAERIDELHHPEWMLRDDLNDYPAHLHIALAPEAQGKGVVRIKRPKAVRNSSGAGSFPLPWGK